MSREGISAVEEFWSVWRALEARRNAAPDPLMARLDPAYPLSLGVVRAGDWPSSVPDLLVAEGRPGVALGEPPGRARREFVAALKEACAGDDWLREHPVEVEWSGGQFASGGIAGDHPLVGLVAGAHRQLHGADPEVHGAPSGSDLRLRTGLGGHLRPAGPHRRVRARRPAALRRHRHPGQRADGMGYTSDRGRAALRRMNAIHARFAIANEDYLYVLATFVFEPIPLSWIPEVGRPDGPPEGNELRGLRTAKASDAAEGRQRRIDRL